MMMVLSEKLTRRPSAPSSSSGRLFLLVLVAGLAVATVFSMMFAGDAEAKKKPKKKKAPPPTSIQAPIPPTPVSQASSLQAPGATFQKPPTNVYQGEFGAQAWGDNITGQLGDGTTADRITPVEVSNLSGIKAIAVGDRHGLALKGDGTVWAWGDNKFAQLGNGTGGNGDYSNVPVQVSNLSGVKAIAGGGGDHSLALKEDGTIWAWGDNFVGQLGDGTTANRNTPVQVSNLSGVKAIAAGGGDLGITAGGGGLVHRDHSLALKGDGTVWAWGSNSDGQLGDGTTANRNTPVQVKNLSGVQAIAAGAQHCLAKVLKPPVAQQ